MISSKEALIRLYDVTLYKDGKEVKWNDKLTVNFQVGTSYNGQTLSVLHEVNGKIETLSGTVSNGILSITANGTGSFGVVVPASTVSTGNSNNGGSTGTVTMATWVVEAQELETEPLRYPALEKSQVRRQEMIQISFSQSQD